MVEMYDLAVEAGRGGVVLGCLRKMLILGKEIAAKFPHTQIVHAAELVFALHFAERGDVDITFLRAPTQPCCGPACCSRATTLKRI